VGDSADFDAAGSLNILIFRRRPRFLQRIDADENMVHEAQRRQIGVAMGTLVTNRGLAIVASAGIGAKLAPRSPPLERGRAGG
jgi:hypothetical protein